MQIIPVSIIRRILIAVVILCASLGFAAPGFAVSVILNPDGNLTYLGSLGGGSYAQDINNAGQVAGFSVNPEFDRHAFITGPNAIGMMDLGTLGGVESFAQGINDAGQVAGSSEIVDGSLHAFITGPNGVGMTDLGTLGKSSSVGTGINKVGQVVGSFAGYFANGSYWDEHAFITGPNGVGMTDLGTLGGNSSYAAGINDTGRVVGFSQTVDGSDHAFITGPNGVGMTDLGTLGGSSSIANDVNEVGQVVGHSQSETGLPHAFITGPNGVGMTDLGTLGGNYSVAYGINDAGQVVGWSSTRDGEHAFITGPNGVGMTDLNSLGGLPARMFLNSSEDINNQGQILVSLVNIIPEPETYALLLAGLALVGFIARLRQTAQRGAIPSCESISFRGFSFKPVAFFEFLVTPTSEPAQQI